MNKILFIIALIASSSAFSSTSKISTVNNIKNRNISLGANIGSRSFTRNQGDIYEDDSFFGVSLAYFVNNKTSIQINYNQGKHPWSFNFDDTDLNGNMEMTNISIHGKYYLKSKSLNPKFNSYFLGGFSSFSRSTSITSQPLITSDDSATGFDVGVGLEFLFNNGRNFVNFQAQYSNVDFDAENSEITIINNQDNIVATGITPDGDPLMFQVGFGIYF